ncbi:MAG TPA: hypothetical protein VFB12_09960 [Ktedonobacteraceae bacterium]|nr:hypothetical protein [Ktedonobacteraceae bacterium]
MASIDEQCEIILGPGNEVTDVPQNERLLALIREAPVWGTEKVLKLSQFLQGYPGTLSTGKHVALVALAMQAGPPSAQLSLFDYQSVNWWEEFFESVESGGEDKGEAEDENNNRALVAGNNPAARENVDTALLSFQIFYRRVPVNGIGLFVETFVPVGVDQAQNARHFILGVAPALS